jgi:hypothetical protein
MEHAAVSQRVTTLGVDLGYTAEQRCSVASLAVMGQRAE